jgi:hypothetical protein
MLVLLVRVPPSGVLLHWVEYRPPFAQVRIRLFGKPTQQGEQVGLDNATSPSIRSKGTAGSDPGDLVGRASRRGRAAWDGRAIYRRDDFCLIAGPRGTRTRSMPSGRCGRFGPIIGESLDTSA